MCRPFLPTGTAHQALKPSPPKPKGFKTGFSTLATTSCTNRDFGTKKTESPPQAGKNSEHHRVQNFTLAFHPTFTPKKQRHYLLSSPPPLPGSDRLSDLASAARRSSARLSGCLESSPPVAPSRERRLPRGPSAFPPREGCLTPHVTTGPHLSGGIQEIRYSSLGSADPGT